MKFSRLKSYIFFVRNFLTMLWIRKSAFSFFFGVIWGEIIVVLLFLGYFEKIENINSHLSSRN